MQKIIGGLNIDSCQNLLLANISILYSILAATINSRDFCSCF